MQQLPKPYLLFLGDTTEAAYAKTARALNQRGFEADFRATGQTGILISGRGDTHGHRRS